jgi:hypothetical protein
MVNFLPSSMLEDMAAEYMTAVGFPKLICQVLAL